MNHAAESYVKLVLALGEHDRDYVDAWYGPAEWRESVKAQKPSLQQIESDAASLLARINAIPLPPDAMEALRREYLIRQAEALLARVRILRGTTMTFDEESQALYDAVAPHHPEEYFQGLLGDLDRELPGHGTIAERLESFRSGFVIPRETLDAVFGKAIDACRERTRQHIALPPGESFTVEYVTDKSWSGYNWYKGGYHSLIQVNTDLPIYIDRAIDLACHEGYPGHHVYNSLLEKNLVRDRGWVEFTVYPLFTPQSLIAEGSANYGIEVAFPADERIEWEKKNLFPIAGLDPSKADHYYRVFSLTDRLSYAGNESARQYLDGSIGTEQAADWLVRYALMSPARAKQRVHFIEQYRSYVINYNLGKDLVRKYVERHAPARGGRWKVFTELLSSPRLPAGLAR